MRGRATVLWLLMGLLFTGMVAGLVLAQRGQAAPESQGSAEIAPTPVTLPFSHQVHAQEVGISCLFCHSQALRSPQAGIPSLQKCMICHEYITVDDPEAQQQVEQLKQAYEQEWRVRWPDVYKQPDFVYFSHRPHIADGVACETCHGDVKSMDLVEKQVEMNMGFCLNCHQQQPEDEKTRLIDCATCHK